MKTKIIFLVLLLVAGCAGITSNNNIKTSSTIYKGNDGLKISFVDNAPPKRVFENSRFDVVVNIENKGAYDVGFDENGGEDGSKDGYLVITPEIGYVDLEGIEEKDDINVEGKKARFKVRGKSLANPTGDYTKAYSKLKSRELSSLSGIHESSVFASICYPYQTKLSTSVCIDPDIYSDVPGEKACEVKDVSFGSGQGAPVTITKVEVEMLPYDNEQIKAHFIVYVENKGKGEIIKRDNYKAACEKEIEISHDPTSVNKYFNVVSFNKEETKLSNSQIKCKQGDKTDIFVLSGSQGIFRCEALINKNVDAYLAPLSIVLDYGYTSTISQQFNIESVSK